MAQIEKDLDPVQLDVTTNCDEISGYVDQIIENVRRLCWDLMPSDLEALGLIAAVSSLVADCKRHYGINIETNFGDMNATLSQESQISAPSYPLLITRFKSKAEFEYLYRT